METSDFGNGQQLILSEEMYNKIERILNDMAANTRCEVAIFCEANGYPILHTGNMRGLDLQAVSSLAANNFSATSQLASMLGESRAFKYLFHEGENMNMYLSNVGFDFILIVIFSKDVALGIVRVFTKKAIEELGELVREGSQEVEETKEILDSEFKSLLTDEINRSLKF